MLVFTIVFGFTVTFPLFYLFDWQIVDLMVFSFLWGKMCPRGFVQQSAPDRHWARSLPRTVSIILPSPYTSKTHHAPPPPPHYSPPPNLRNFIKRLFILWIYLHDWSVISICFASHIDNTYYTIFTRIWFLNSIQRP